MTVQYVHYMCFLPRDITVLKDIMLCFPVRLCDDCELCSSVWRSTDSKHSFLCKRYITSCAFHMKSLDHNP